MTALADDRVLDYALQVLHGKAATVDLTERIVEAWERGARGVSLRDLDAQPVRAVEAAPVVRPQSSPWRWRVAAAAALLVAGGSVALWMVGTSSPPLVVARAQTPVLVLRAGAATTLTTGDFQAGDVIAVPSDRSSALVLDGGQSITANAGAIVALHRRERAFELELLRGRASIEATGGEIALDAGFLRAVASAGAAVAFELAAPSTDPLDAALIERLRQRRDQPGAVRFEVERGELWLEHRGGRERLVAGVEREMWNAVASTEADVDGEKRVRTWAEAMLRPVPLAAMEKLGWDEMLAYFATHPQRWETLREAVLARLDGARKAGALQTLLHFGLADPTGEGLAFVRELWLHHPEGFSDIEIAALAERGLFEFEREAAAMLADDDRSRPETMVVALLARRGDARAADALRRELDEPRDARRDDFLRIAYAGYALVEGGDPSAWRRAIDALRPSVERELSQRRFVDASACIPMLRMLDQALSERRPVPVEMLIREGMRGAYAESLADAEAIRRELDELASRR